MVTESSTTGARPVAELPPPPHSAPRRVTGLGLGSVAKVSLLIYAVFGLALVTAAVLLALASQAFGLTAHVDHFARSVFNIKSLTLRPAVVAEWAAVLAAAVMVVGALLHVLCAFLYNRIVDLTGGIGVHLQRDAAAPTGRQ